jgi:hypothetical protein
MGGSGAAQFRSRFSSAMHIGEKNVQFVLARPQPPPSVANLSNHNMVNQVLTLACESVVQGTKPLTNMRGLLS